jgi:hypothetical protein
MRWIGVVAVAGLALLAGARVVGAQTEDEPPAEEPPARLQPFLDCVADEGIDLPDLRAHRRDREPLSEDERAAVEAAREACGDQLPHAEDRAALRQCLTDALAEDDTTSIRALTRGCAEELGIDLPRRPRWCRRQH